MRGWLLAVALALAICPGSVRPAHAGPAGSAASRNNEGNRLYDQKRYDEALKMYTDAQAARPDAPELHYNIGNVLFRKQEYDKANEEYLKAQSSIDPALEQAAVFNRGNALLMQGRFQEAVGAYVQALRARSDDADAKRNLELALKLLQEQAKQPKGGGSKDQQKQDQNQEGAEAPRPQPDRQEPQGHPKQKPKPGQMTEEEVRQVLEALRAEEKETIRKHARALVPDRRDPERDW